MVEVVRQVVNLRGALRVLTPAQQAFVMAYAAGESDTLGNARRSYLAAFPSCSSVGAASVSANRLLSMRKVRARLLEVRADAERAARARLRSWWALAPDAQRTLELASAGLFDPMPKAAHGVRAEAIRSGVRAASEILSRAEGTPQQLHELRIEAGITVAIAGPAQLMPGEDDVPLGAVVQLGSQRQLGAGDPPAREVGNGARTHERTGDEGV